MLFNEERHHNRHFVRKADYQGIQVNDTDFQHSIILAEHQAVKPWPVSSVEQLTCSDFDWLNEQAYEVILIGTGLEPAPLPPAVHQWFIKNQWPVEIMTTKTAAQTYNIVASDHRQVIAALVFNSTQA